ncbi:hypothetical protein CCP1ISM_60024 [Azospirillaceae bacterium]
MQHSIVPYILSEKKIKFLDERDIPITLCSDSGLFVPAYDPPYLVIDTFAKKTTKKEEIVSIDLEELNKLDYVITVRSTSKGWFRGQKVIYYLEKKSERKFKKMSYIPGGHKIQKDIPNKRIRLYGSNAGINNFGPWQEIK